MRRWGRHSYAWRDHKAAKVGCATRMLDATLSPRCHWCAWREPRRWSAKMLRATLSQKGHSQVWRELRRESGTVLTGTGDGSAARMPDRPRRSGEAVAQRQRRQGEPELSPKPPQKCQTYLESCGMTEQPTPHGVTISSGTGSGRATVAALGTTVDVSASAEASRRGQDSRPVAGP